MELNPIINGPSDTLPRRKGLLWRMFDFISHASKADPARLKELEKTAEVSRESDFQRDVVRAMLEYSKEHPDVDRTPQIAIIGKTGVGKSTTINKLFDPQPNLPVDHIEPATKSIEILTLSLGDRGHLIFVDCPGLGDSEEADNRNIKAYREILHQSDVAVWILKADERALGVDQNFIRQVLPEELRRRLIVGINQIDKIEPGEWNLKYNLPSPEQEKSIPLRVEYVRKRFAEAGIVPFAIIPYSAKKNRYLLKLFRAMVDACPSDRVPSLVTRSSLDSFVSPSVLLAVENIETESPSVSQDAENIETDPVYLHKSQKNS